MSITLHQFQFSHFNDKARWALDYKGIEHHRLSYLPGPHMRYLKALSGQTSTPVMDIDNEIIAGTANILDRIEQDYPTPPLYPQDAAQKGEALKLQAQYDAQLGPATRSLLFSVLVHEGDYLCSMFAKGKPALKQALYRASFPIARGLMRKANGVNPQNIERSRQTTLQIMDEIAAKTAATGYLIGSQFTVADLTAAALLAPLADPRHPDMARPEPVPAAVADLLAQYADHPAISWTNTLYERHRG